MGQAEIDFDAYSSKLESFLLQLRKEITSICQADSNELENLKDRDLYIYEVNSFYYKSFHERFFPEYKSSIQQDFSRLLNLSRQEEIVKSDILSNIKRYANLYNQVKNTSGILAQIREENNQQLLSISRNSNQRSMDLLYALKKIRDNLKLLNDAAQDLIILSQDKELLASVKKRLENSALLKFFSSMDINDSLQMDSLTRLMAELHQSRNLLVKLQLDTPNARQITDELIRDVGKKRSPFFKNSLYATRLFEDNIQKTLLKFTELLHLNMQANNTTRVKKIAHEFEEYLNDFLFLMDKAVYYKTENRASLLDSSSLIANLKQDDIQKLQEDISSNLQSVESIIGELPDSGEADFAYFSKKTRDMLELNSPCFFAASTKKEFTHIGPLAFFLNRVSLELSFLEMKLDLWDEKYEHYSWTLNSLLKIINTLDSYINFLSNIKSDLERLLAPRNISRSWKDMLIRVERLALEKGKIFPENYLHLLDKYHVETRISEDATNTILHEEGDIFLIRVDDLQEEELPYLVVSQKA